jgi:hypothetical protein
MCKATLSDCYWSLVGRLLPAKLSSRNGSISRLSALHGIGYCPWVIRRRRFADLAQIVRPQRRSSGGMRASG